MHALAAQRVQIGGQGGHQRFAFTGAHLGDASLMQDDAADDLHGEVTHAQHPIRRLAAGGKRFRQNIVQRLAGFQPVFQLIGLGPQSFVGHGAVFLFQREHLVAQGLDALDLPLAVIAEKSFQKSHGS